MDYSKTFFSSDWHLKHNNIIKYCNRPFDNVNEMYSVMLRKYNETVRKDDILFHLGDVLFAPQDRVYSLKKEIDRFNGDKHLVLGNHDEWKTGNYVTAGFSTVHTHFWFQYAGLEFYLAHDPSMYNTIQHQENAVLICGHVHNLFKHLLPGKRVINVGVDVWDFRPVSMAQILELLSGFIKV